MGRKSLVDWKTIIERQLNSGLTAAEFCRQNNLNQKYFSQYKCKFKKVPPAFIKVSPKVLWNLLNQKPTRLPVTV
ncbi:MAG: hypothetical protein V7784_23300 [Oceanospirillaceae bacterium]